MFLAHDVTKDSTVCRLTAVSCKFGELIESPVSEIRDNFGWLYSFWAYILAVGIFVNNWELGTWVLLENVLVICSKELLCV